MKSNFETHNLEPIYDKNSKVLLLGSFPSPKSRGQGFYYAHPQNKMWKVLAKVCDAEVPQEIEEKKSLLLEHHIAMWDVLESCEIEGASDLSIKNGKPNDLTHIIAESNIKVIFTVGSKATQYYKRYCEKIYDLPYYQLPSTSPANASMNVEKLAEKFSEIKKYI